MAYRDPREQVGFANEGKSQVTAQFDGIRAVHGKASGVHFPFVGPEDLAALPVIRMGGVLDEVPEHPYIAQGFAVWGHVVNILAQP